MERTRGNLHEQCTYRKIGGGSLRWKGQIIKPNQVFSAFPEEIPQAFKDSIVLVQGVDAPVAPPPPSTFAVKEALVPTITEDKNFSESGAPEEETPNLPPSPQAEYALNGKGGWYDVINTVSGKRMNEKRLRKADADELLQRLVTP